LKKKRKIMKVGEINKKAEETGNCTKLLDTTRKCAVCGNKDPRLNN
jgi:hypothetical protein